MTDLTPEDAALCGRLEEYVWPGSAGDARELVKRFRELSAQLAEHPTAEDYRNRAERAEQALAERDALITEAAQIIGQIEPDHRYPPAPDSMERRLDRARYWVARSNNSTTQEKNND